MLAFHDTTVAVVGILAQTHVGNHHEPRHGLLDGVHRLLYCARRAIGFPTERVFAFRQSEEQHGWNAMVQHRPGFCHGLINREMVLSWQ